MSRSKRKLKMPIACDKGIKWYKQYHSGKERAQLRIQLAAGNHDVAFQLIPWNEWDCPRDGYQLIQDQKYTRK